MSEINFDMGESIWSAAIMHNTPETDGIWLLAFNAQSEKEAIDKATKLFAADGLPVERIISIEVSELTIPKDGDSIGDS